jgi:hypothetical protein
MLNKKLVTKKAEAEMIDIHSQKYLKAWLDITQYGEKAASLQKDYDLLSAENKAKVEEYIDKRLKNPNGEMAPDISIAQAVATKMGLDTMQTELKKAQMEFDFFAKVIEQLKSI